MQNIIIAHGQDDFSTELLEDVIGEITNTLSGNSRKELGSHFVISVPQVVHGNAHALELTDGAHSFVIPLKWSNMPASMVVSVINN